MIYFFIAFPENSVCK